MLSAVLMKIKLTWQQKPGVKLFATPSPPAAFQEHPLEGVRIASRLRSPEGAFPHFSLPMSIPVHIGSLTENLFYFAL